MKNHFFSSDDEQHGGPKAPLYWWRTANEFEEDGNFKVDVSDPSTLTPRLKLLREMERLGLFAAEGLSDMSRKLLIYRAGDFWLPIGGITKSDMDIPPVITLLLAGLTGSGKSSFINLMYAVLGRFGVVPFAQTSGESSNSTTMNLEEHNVLRSPKSGFCVFDSRGLDQNRVQEGLDEVSTWMFDGVQHNQPCHRPGDEKLNEQNESLELTNSRYLKRKVNFVMVVADLSQIHSSFKSGDLKSVEALRSLFHLPAIKTSNENPLLILTHGDTLNSEDRINGRLKICEYLGIPETSGAYDVPCLTEQWIPAEESDPVSAYALTEAVYRALLQSDRTHSPKWSFKEWVIFLFSWIMWCLASLFAVLAHFFSSLGHPDGRLKKLNR